MPVGTAATVKDYTGARKMARESSALTLTIYICAGARAIEAWRCTGYLVAAGNYSDSGGFRFQRPHCAKLRTRGNRFDRNLMVPSIC